MNRNSEPIQVHYGFVFLLSCFLWMLGLSATWGENSSGKQPPPKPILRLETGSHTAALWNIDVDDANRFMVTCSNDKTVRVWDLSSYKLVKTLRPPIANGQEGEIHAVAISPDGETIACGGHTGRFWDDTYSVYLFNRQTGKIIKRLTGFPGSIHHLGYSKDGRFLAIGYWKGLRVYRVPSYVLAGQDVNYGNRCSWADFDQTGRLVTASRDGLIRLYNVTAENIQLIAKQIVLSRPNLFSISFSPDGSKIATGYLLSSAFSEKTPSHVDVFSGKDLTYLYSPDTSTIKRGLESVAWSSDGRSLYAGGYPRAIRRKKFAPIVKWEDAGLGSRMVLRAGKSPIQDIVPLKNGGILFAAYNSSWGAFNRHDERFFHQRSNNPDFRGLPSRKIFLISEDADKVAFSFRARGKSLALFNIEDRSLEIDPTLDDSFLEPIFLSPGIGITDWFMTRSPKLNGKKLQLRTGEQSLCLAIAPDGNSFILGTEWSLYHFDTQGKQIWKIPVHSIALSVNISKNSRVVVAASGDGTIHWYRMEDGKEILSLFLHTDRTRWIAWTPEGYYMSSLYGDELIGWHLNNGKDRESDFYAAVQFERILYRPNYVLNYFRHFGNFKKDTQLSGKQPFDIDKLASIAPPRIKIISPQYGGSISSDRIRLKIAAEKRSLPMQSCTVFVNSIPVTPSDERSLSDMERDAFIREAEVPLFDYENTIRVEVFNGTSMGLAESVFNRSGNARVKAKGDLYLLSVGVDDFNNMPFNNLKYAAFDAENIAGFFQKEEGKVFNHVFAKVISDHSESMPSKKNIVNSLNFIKKARAQDTVIVFLASHGLSDNDGNYYFVPRDAQVKDVKKILEAGVRGSIDSTANASTLISWETFFDALRSVPGKRLLVVDTCQAKNIEGTFDIHSLAKRSVTSSFAILAASKGPEESQEYPQGKQGLFTYAILKGLSGNGDRNKDGRIVLSELYEFIAEFVEMNRNKEIGEQTPQLAAPEELKDMILAVQ